MAQKGAKKTFLTLEVITLDKAHWHDSHSPTQNPCTGSLVAMYYQCIHLTRLADPYWILEWRGWNWKLVNWWRRSLYAKMDRPMNIVRFFDEIFDYQY